MSGQIKNLKVILITALIAAVLFSSPAFAKSANDNKAVKKSRATLVAHWPMNEGSGNIANDITVPSQPGVIVKAAWEKNAGECALGSCLSFNGKNSYVHILGKPAFDADGLTVSAWVYSDNFCKQSDCHAIILEKSKMHKAEDDDYLVLETVKVGANVFPRFSLKIKGRMVSVVGNQNEAAGKFTNGLWTHIAAVYDGDDLTIFKNGIVVGTVATKGQLRKHGAGQLRIGASADVVPQDLFFGKLDDIRIYRDDLSAAEIAQLVSEVKLNLFCGDKVVQSEAGESCDDGNSLNDDGCTNKCVKEYCGDKIVQPGLYEECDGNSIVSCSTWEYQGVKECDSKCHFSECHLLEYCGDGKIQNKEACDDGNPVDGDGCSSKCVKEFCGDKIVQPNLGEDCDDANDIETDGCSTTCKAGFCGDSVIQAPKEKCDQNSEPCTTSNGYPGTQDCLADCGNFSECHSELFCGDNICTTSVENPSNCLSDCPSVCGNSVIEGHEACDDGNVKNSDGCDQFCVVEFCGDGVVQNAMGEECDDTNNDDTDLCTNHCTQNICTVNYDTFVPVKLSTAPVCNGSFVSSPVGMSAWTTNSINNQCDVMLNLNNGAMSTRVTATSTNEKLLSVNDQGWVAWDNDHPQLGKKIYYYHDEMTFEIDNTLFGSTYSLSSGRYDNTAVQLSTTHYAVWLGKNPDATTTFDVVHYNFDTQQMSRITNNTYPDENVRINSFGKYVWQGSTDGQDMEIFYSDESGIHQLTNNQANDINPRINDNGWIVWQSFDGNDYEIALFDGENITIATDNNFDDMLPQINNKNEVAWIGAVDNKSSVDQANHEIFMYDQGFVMQLTDNDTKDSSVQINQNSIVAWIGRPTANTVEAQEVFINVQGNNYRLTNDSIADRDVQIGNEYIFWIKGNTTTALDLFKAHLPVSCHAN